jgi:hypothetical protein
MSGPVIPAVYVAAMVSLIVGVDIAFFRGHVWERLMVNAGIVLVFVAVYLRFIGRPWAPWR